MKKIYKYPAIFERGEAENEAAYGVRFPDIPRGVTAGDDLENAKSMACELLELMLRDYVENGDTLPVPGLVKENLSKWEHIEMIEINVDLEDDDE